MAYKVGSIEVMHTTIAPLDADFAHFDGHKPGSTVLHKGFKRHDDCRAFDAETVWEKDIEIPLRDGTKLYGDVFYPAEVKEKIPILLAWSPYGKSGRGYFDVSMIPRRDGIPRSKVSGFQSFEAPDPAVWTGLGYAVANVDARGIFKSEGQHRWHGTAEGRDGYDTIEHLGKLPWSNGRVVLIGNSWLATAQWFIAAERPPHLAAVMPLEGLSDVYRETLCRGGVPYKPFWNFLGHRLVGENGREDAISMIEKYPLMNEYWEDKRGKSHLINVPAYILASMSTGLHTVGSTRSYEDIPHEKKWLRINPTQEWYDLYQDDSVEDFRKFLDFYTKDIKNGWEQTPRARVSILRFNQDPLVNVPFANWPVPETEYHRFFLQENGQLSKTAPADVKTISYQADAPALQMDTDPEEVQFRITFKEKTTLIGASKAVLYVSCPDHHDLDVFVQLRKADKDGIILRNFNIPLKDFGQPSGSDEELINTLQYLGPTGILRASHRTLDPVLSKPHWPAHDHSKEVFIPAGEIVKLEIGIWVSAMQFDAGEQLVLKVAGHQMTLAEFEPTRGLFETGNKGKHILHFGGKSSSYVELPLIPL